MRKRSYTVLFSLLALCISAWSCGKEEESEEKDAEGLVGTWSNGNCESDGEGDDLQYQKSTTTFTDTAVSYTLVNYSDAQCQTAKGSSMRFAGTYTLPGGNHFDVLID